MKKNEKGFTLVELLAVIVILGLLMAIAIPSVTKYITQSRVKTLVSTMDSYVTAVVTQVNDGEYKFSDSSKIFAIPIECVALEKGGTNPFGNWMQANEAYWAYVLVHYDSDNYTYEYGFTFKDDAGYGMYPTLNANITSSMVRTGYDDLNKPTSGLAINYVEASKWEGFNITSTTELVVLEAESEGVEGDGKTTCTLCQKGDNYNKIEQEKQIRKPCTGTSKTVGGEVTCGTESFYIIYIEGGQLFRLFPKNPVDVNTYKQSSSAGNVTYNQAISSTSLEGYKNYITNNSGATVREINLLSKVQAENIFSCTTADNSCNSSRSFGYSFNYWLQESTAQLQGGYYVDAAGVKYGVARGTTSGIKLRPYIVIHISDINFN